MDFKITGADDLSKALMALAPKVEKNILRGAVRAGSVVIQKEAQARAPVLQSPDPRRKAGTLKNAIKVRGSKVVQGKVVVGGVVVRPLTAGQIAKFKARSGSAGANNPNDPFYANFVEFGTVKMAPRPFMRPALSSKAQSAIDTVAQYTRDRLDAEVKS
jgi:HK97 gp10 family phage protein